MIFEHQITFETSDGTRYNTWRDWHLLPTERPSVKPPVPKSNQIEIPGSNGILDDSTFPNGYPVFNNRQDSWTFKVINSGTRINEDHGVWYERYSEIMNAISGKFVKVILDDDPNHYYEGRVWVNDFNSPHTWAEITISYDLFPYKFEFIDAETDAYTVDGSNQITLYGSDMPVAPKMIVTSRRYIFMPENVATRAMAIQFLYRYNELIHGSSPYDTSVANPFYDVTEDDWFYVAVQWGYQHGHIAGYTDHLFGPNNPCTRAQFVQMLWRVYGSYSVEESIPFVDVKDTDYYYMAVRWAYANSLVAGTSATSFSPNQAITRAQAVFILWKAYGSPDASIPADEEVIDVSDKINNKPWYYDAVMWTYTHGYMAGTSQTTFDPAVESTRAHFYTVLCAWYGGHATNKPFDGTWPAKFAEWKVSQSSYSEPTTILQLQTDMRSAGLYFTSAEYNKMWSYIQYGITYGISSCPFTDIVRTQYFYYPAIWAWYKGYTAGVDTNTFGGNVPIMRWQCVYCLWKVAGEHTATVGNRASDVPASAIYAPAVDWAVEVGITALETTGKFNPEGIATRAMIALFFYRLEQWWGGTDESQKDTSITTDSPPFTDISNGDVYYTKAVDWALSNNIAAKAGAGLTLNHNGKKLKVSDGESIMPQIILDKNGKTLDFEGYGTVQFKYRRGSL